jgi:hypothetical protein
MAERPIVGGTGRYMFLMGAAARPRQYRPRAEEELLLTKAIPAPPQTSKQATP